MSDQIREHMRQWERLIARQAGERAALAARHDREVRERQERQERERSE